jgi:hypothetical protein
MIKLFSWNSNIRNNLVNYVLFRSHKILISDKYEKDHLLKYEDKNKILNDKIS